MADFQQNGLVATLHRLGQPDRPALEAELGALAARRPLALILPALASDLQGPALERLLDELAQASFVGEVVVSLGRAGKRELARARQLLAALPQPCLVLHNEGRAQQRLLSEMAQAGLAVGQEGKGRAVWLALGLVLARGRSRVAALADCDVLDYDRLMLARLVYPLLNPELGYRFAKGYYPRFTHRLYGRVTRLFVGPLLLALRRLLGPWPYLEFLGAFRYPLSGEWALDLELARDLALPGDWGLEVGALGQIWQRLSPAQVCQVDIAESYEHKHQAVSHDDPHKGLARMCAEIARCLLADLAGQGVVMTQGLARSLRAAYPAAADSFLRAYAADAALNGLTFDWPEEDMAVRTFARGLARGMEAFLEEAAPVPALCPWRRALASLPDLGHRLIAAVEEDNR